MKTKEQAARLVRRERSSRFELASPNVALSEFDKFTLEWRYGISTASIQQDDRNQSPYKNLTLSV